VESRIFDSVFGSVSYALGALSLSLSLSLDAIGEVGIFSFFFSMSRGCVDGEVDYAVIGYLVGLVFDLMYHTFFSWSWIEGMDDGMRGRGKKEKKEKKRERGRGKRNQVPADSVLGEPTLF